MHRYSREWNHRDFYSRDIFWPAELFIRGRRRVRRIFMRSPHATGSAKKKKKKKDSKGPISSKALPNNRRKRPSNIEINLRDHTAHHTPCWLCMCVHGVALLPSFKAEILAATRTRKEEKQEERKQNNETQLCPSAKIPCFFFPSRFVPVS